MELARLIDADKIPYEECYVPDGDIQWDYKRALIVEKEVIDRMPTEAEAKVVRCKECIKRYDPDECPMCHQVEGESSDYTNDDGYCDRGERRTDDR